MALLQHFFPSRRHRTVTRHLRVRRGIPRNLCHSGTHESKHTEHDEEHGSDEGGNACRMNYLVHFWEESE